MADGQVCEEWRAIPGYEGFYEVSNEGRVRSLPRRDARARPRSGRVLQGYRRKDGYPCVWISPQSSQSHTRAIHTLVALAFIGPRPPGLEVCHEDGDRTNNAASNLRYDDTHSANMYDAVRHGTHAHAARTHCHRGHAFTPENTYIYKGARTCRACNVIRQAAHRQRVAS